jgi:hypothetical protein
VVVMDPEEQNLIVFVLFILVYLAGMLGTRW